MIGKTEIITVDAVAPGFGRNHEIIIFLSPYKQIAFIVKIDVFHKNAVAVCVA